MAAGTVEGVLWDLSGELGKHWKRVARGLGFNEAGIDYLKEDYPNDARERAYQMLLQWRNRTKAASLVVDLTNAFIRAERFDLMKFVSSLVALGGVVRTRNFDVQKFTGKVKSFIKRKMSKLPLIPWMSTRCVNIDQVFTNVQLLINIATAYLPLRLPLKSYNSIFESKEFSVRGIQELSSNRVLVRGRTGSGKTTLLTKYAYDWSMDRTNSLFSDPDVVVILPMRKLDQYSNLGQAVLDHYMLPADENMTAEGIEEFFRVSPKEGAILLDGYDEFKGKGLDQEECGNIVELLRGDAFEDTRVIVSTRPGRVGDFQSDYESYRHIEITGFSSEDIDKYVRNVFRSAPDPELGEKLIVYLEENQLKDGLASIPLMLTAFCQLAKWTDGKDFGELNTVNKLFDRLLECVFIHENSKTVTKKAPVNADASQRPGSSLTSDQLLHELGKVALDGLLGSAGEELLFSEEDFSRCIDKEQVIEQGIRAGILSRDEDSSLRPQSYEGLGMRGQPQSLPKNLSFILKSFQEKCAGNYLAHLLDEEEGAKPFLEYLSRVDKPKRILDMVNVLVFASGVSLEAAGRVIEHVVRVLMDHRGGQISQYLKGALDFKDCPETQRLIELCLQLNFESEAAGKFNHLFERIFGESGCIRLVGISNYVAKSLCYLFEHSGLSSSDRSNANNHVLSLKGLNLISVRLESSTQFREFLNCYPGAEKTITDFMRTSVSGDSDDRVPNLEKNILESKLNIPKYLMNRSDGLTISAVLPIWQEINKRKAHDFSLGFVLAGLRKCELSELTLNGVMAEETDWDKLFQMMADGLFVNLTKLTLSINDLASKQTARLASVLHSCPGLRYLKLSGNRVGEEFLDNLGAMPKLENIILDSTGLSARAMVQSANTFRGLPALHKIDMRRNVDTNDDVIRSFCENLRDGRLTELRISLHKVSEEGLRCLQTWVGQFSGLTHLNLVHTPIPDKVVYYSALAIASLPGLVDLRISGIESFISEESVLCSSTSVHEFTRKLNETTSLTFLSLLYIRMSPVDFLKFLDGCRNHTTLRTLRFSRSCLPDGDDVKTACDEVEGKFLNLWV